MKESVADLPSENSLIAASKSGDTDAFDQLIRRYEDKIFRLAKSVCSGLPSDAEDVYQETFLTAFEKIGKFRKDSNLGTWLYRIAANLCWMRHRKRKREPFVPLLDDPARAGRAAAGDVKDWTFEPDEAAQKREIKETVRKALQELPVDYRLVLSLRGIERLSNEETATVLGLSAAAVKSRLHRGRMFLRDRLDAYMSGRSA